MKDKNALHNSCCQLYRSSMVNCPSICGTLGIFPGLQGLLYLTAKEKKNTAGINKWDFMCYGRNMVCSVVKGSAVLLISIKNNLIISGTYITYKGDLITLYWLNLPNNQWENNTEEEEKQNIYNNSSSEEQNLTPEYSGLAAGIVGRFIKLSVMS